MRTGVGSGTGAGISASGPATSRQTAGPPPPSASLPSRCLHHATISAGVARSPGSAARQRANNGRRGSGSRERSGSECTIRYSTLTEGPSPYSGSPSAANAAVWPSAKMSVAAVTSPADACSGAMNWGVPMAPPVAVCAVVPDASEMPKSITRGPSAASSTLDGFRSRCTIPEPWMACRASATPATSHSSAGTGSGPRRATASVSEGPGTYRVASQGGVPSASASISSAVYAPLTRRAASTSRRKRRRNAGSSASSGRTTLIATGRPPWVCDR